MGECDQHGSCEFSSPVAPRLAALGASRGSEPPVLKAKLILNISQQGGIQDGSPGAPTGITQDDLYMSITMYTRLNREGVNEVDKALVERLWLVGHLGEWDQLYPAIFLGYQ